MAKRTYNYTNVFNHKSKVYIGLLGSEVEGLGVMLISGFSAILLTILLAAVFSIFTGGGFGTLAFAFLISAIITVLIASQLNEVEDEKGLSIVSKTKNFYNKTRKGYRYIVTHDGKLFELGRKRKGKTRCMRV